MRSRFFILAISVSLFVCGTVAGQPVDPEWPVPEPLPELPVITAPQEEPERSLQVLRRPDSVGSDALVDGTHGHIYLNGTSPWEAYGVGIKADSNWPHVGVELGASTYNERFNVFNSARSVLFTVRGDGRVGAGVDPLWRLHSYSAVDSMGALYAHTRTTVEADASQVDYSLFVLGHQDVLTGVTNSGSIHGMRLAGMLIGAGTVTSAYGLIVDAGLTSGGTGTVTNAYGVRVSVPKGAGTVTNGFGLMIDDVQGTTGYGIYQSGANDRNHFGADVNYFVGNVGVGTNSPAAGVKLHVSGSTSQFARIEALSADQVAALQLKNDARTWQLYVDGTADDKFHIRDSSGGLNRVTVDTAGRVGIGTTAPTARLEVAGDIRGVGNAHFDGTVTGGNIKAKYQDVAEWVPATTDLAPGTVVILNAGKINEVMASNGAYDSTVAGVVSAQPGLSLGEEGEGKEQIATTGRVKVRVDARGAAIRVGDLLVTSDVPGTAMRSEPMTINGRKFHQPGTIIGKALEPLESGMGEILVLLSMQ